MERGFTLVEMIVVVALIAMLTVVAIPSYQNAAVKNDTQTAATTIITTLRRAQFLAQGVSQDSAWGVRTETGTVTLFKGATYAGRDAAYDETYVIGRRVVPSGQTDTIFTAFTGVPSGVGALTLTPVTGSPKTILINAKGIITAQ